MVFRSVGDVGSFAEGRKIRTHVDRGKIKSIKRHLSVWNSFCIDYQLELIWVLSDLNIPRIFRSSSGVSIRTRVQKTRDRHSTCCGGYVMSMHASIASSKVTGCVATLFTNSRTLSALSPPWVRLDHRWTNTGSTVPLSHSSIALFISGHARTWAQMSRRF